MSDETDSKVLILPIKKREKGTNTLTVVHYSECRHERFEVDEKLSEVKCKACGQKMNPMWVLVQIAHRENRLSERLLNLRTECRLLEGRVRTKCDNCGKMTRIRSSVTNAEAQKVADQIRAEE